MATKTGQGQNRTSLNAEKKGQLTQVSSTSMTMAAIQRKNREAAQKRKSLAIRIAGGFAIGLHVIGVIVGTIYFVQKTVLDMNTDKVDSVVLEVSKPQPKRRTPLRTARKPTKPKFSKIRAPEGQTVTTSAKIPMGNTSFSLPVSKASIRPVMALSTTGIGKDMLETSRQQVTIVTAMPKFEVSKFESTSFVARMDMGTNLAQTEFNDAGNLELASVNLGDTKQSFNEYLNAVRDRIKQAQRFPPRVRHFEDGRTTTVQFTLFKDGTVWNPEVTTTSGSHVLDNAALTAVRNAVPYPPFPDGQEGISLRLEIPIIFQLAN